MGEFIATLPVWVQGLLALLLPVFGALAQNFLNKRKENRIDFDLIVKRLDNENNECKETNQLLIKKVAMLENKVLLLESAHQSLPVPMWLKSMDGTMLALNPAYERVFLKPNGLTTIDYIGKQDHEVWPEDIASAFRTHDIKVQTSGKTLETTEIVPIDGVMTKWHIIKYVRFSDGIPIGIGGMAVKSEIN